MPPEITHNFFNQIMEFLINQLPTLLVGLPSLGVILWYLLKKKFEARIARGLEVTKHELKVEQFKLSIIYEHQKDSFRRIIIAMHNAIKSIEGPYDEPWGPISKKVFDKFKQTIIEESIFVGAEGEFALNLFQNILGRIIFVSEEYHYDVSYIDSEVRKAYDQLIYISEQVREYFRSRIGLSNQEDMLIGVKLLGACLLVNRRLPENVFQQYENDSTIALVSFAKNNLTELERELINIIDKLKKKADEKKYYANSLSEAERYYIELFGSRE